MNVAAPPLPDIAPDAAPDTSPDTAIDMGPLTGLIGYALRRAQLAVFHDFNRTMEAEAIRPAQYSVLKVLQGNPGLRQGQVSMALGIKRANFVPLLDELQRRGLTERRTVPEDRRAKGLFLTPHGAKLLAALDAKLVEHEARFVARIGQQGKKILLGLLQQLSDSAFDTNV